MARQSRTFKRHEIAGLGNAPGAESTILFLGSSV